MSRIYEASYEVTQKGRLNQFLKSFSLKGYSQEKMTRWPVDIWQGCQSHWPSGKYSTPTRISKFKRPTISSVIKGVRHMELSCIAGGNKSWHNYLENSLGSIFYSYKHTHTLSTKQSTSWYLPKRNECICPPKTKYKYSQNS